MTLCVGTRNAHAFAVVCMCLNLIQACAAMPTEKQIRDAENSVEVARRADALRCAPRELALSETNLEFAKLEMSQGDPERAHEHLQEAELNAKAAIRMQGADCKGSAGPVQPLQGMVSVQADDRDGDGIRDRVDLCPDTPEDLDGFVDRDGCPEVDNDQDGIVDALDRCPLDPEDKDGFEDEDGCPDMDNDRDGVADASDECPRFPGSQAAQGCSLDDYRGVTLTDTQVELDPRLNFASGSATLDAAQKKLLGELARLLRDRPSLSLSIEAHTDSRGDDTKNLELTSRQAEAVRQALIEQGIQASRLTAKGYGETRPLESNRTSQGRAMNRRVEILRTDVGKR